VYNRLHGGELVGMTNDSSTSTVCTSCGAKASGKFCISCGAALGSRACRNCDAALPAGARFCNECGTPVGETAAVATGAPAGGDGNAVARYVPWAVAGVALVAAVAYFAGQGNGSDAPAQTAAATDAGAAPFAPFANGAAGGASGAPDISSMTPRERAGRLYDRIMRYAEQGKKDSLATFAPMAMASFEMLGAELDLDARYDYGRVASEVGAVDVAAAQADTILRQSPTHLLGLSLKARVATLRGDAAGATNAWQAFAAAKDAELKKNLPEYQMHATDIEMGAQRAAGGK
jgi:hypothetical protein